jgi:hypothetical protein
MIDKIPQFWQGVLASLLATIVVAIAAKLWAVISTQARENQCRKQQCIQDIRSKMKSGDSILRVEGYFTALFTLLKYIFVSIILWVVAWGVSFFEYTISLLVALASLSVCYLGLRWLYGLMRPPVLVSTDPSGKKLELHSAKYGAMGEFRDITAILAERLTQGHLQVYAGNHLAGDPCQGVGKELIVDYSYDGERHTRIVREGEILSLP